MSIEFPQDRMELIQHCKMRIGEPIIKVNVTDTQALIRVKEAVRMFLDYHFEFAYQCFWPTRRKPTTDCQN